MEIKDKEGNKKSSKMVFDGNFKKPAAERGKRADGRKLPLLKIPVPGIKRSSFNEENDIEKMSDFSIDPNKTEMAAVMKNFGKQQSPSAQQQQQQQQQQVLKNTTSTSSTSRIAKTSHSSSSQRVHHVTSSEMMKSDLSELKSSISEMKNLSGATAFRLRSSREDLDRDDLDAENGELKSEPLVTFPDPDTPPPVTNSVTLSSPNLVSNMSPNGIGGLITNGVGHLTNANHVVSTSASSSSTETVKFEQKRMTSASKTKVLTDSFSSDQGLSNSAEVKRMQTSDISIKEQMAASAMRSRMEIEGVTAEKSLAMKQDQRTLTVDEISQQESQNMTATSMKMQTEAFSSEKKAISQQQQRQTVTSSGIFNHEKHMAQSSQSNYTITSKGVSKSVISAAQMHSLPNNGLKNSEEELLSQGFEDLERLDSRSSSHEVDSAIKKYSNTLHGFIQLLRGCNGSPEKGPKILNKINQMIQKAWEVPTHGHELGYSLCNALRNCGGLDLLMFNCVATDKDLQFSSARLLEQCLTTENRAHVVENGLEKVVKVACVCTKNVNNEYCRVGTGILEHLFKHSEGTCSDVIRLGGLDAVLFECRKNDVETLRHCASALANLSLYGGAENQEAMITRKVPMWLFPLAFHNDDNIKYYACLAIAVLVANKEIEAAVLKSGTLDLVEPFVTSHNPSEFAKSNLAHAHGQSKHWLQRLVPVLSSKREEARNLAAFHFCMEAGIKKQQGNTEIFREIGAIEPLKKCASCPNAVASKYAAQALRLIGEEVPHKLSQQVPLWSTEDVREWVKQIGFAEYACNFVESRVDGDLLLQLTEENLKDDIGISNGIRRKRFTRELQNLKKMADYSSRDTTNLNSFLQTIGPEFPIYTYSMLNAGVDKDSLRNLKEEQLMQECGISNSIHRLRILDTIKVLEDNIVNSSEENLDKSLDVFVSYRRSNGSQLASLLKVHLQLRGFTVFIDVERLEAGKFDNNLLQSIRQAKFFLLVLTPKALERCIADVECKDWVHREIVAALQSQCNIIPIIDNFQWPEPEELPEDMRAVCHFNGVRWIHDYQDACVDKLERFMRGELGANPGRMIPGKGDVTPSTPSTLGRQPPNYQRMHSNESNGKGSDKDSGGRPPMSPKSKDRQPPQGRTRRSSAQSPLPTGRVSYFAKPVLPTSRSRSLDGLLDAPSEEPYVEKENQKYLNDSEGERKDSDYAEEGEKRAGSEEAEGGADEGEVEKTEAHKLSLTKSRSYEDRLNSESSTEGSGSMLSLTSTGDSKRKQNFMNKCVNKVKNFIKK